jgi:flagellar hook-length control protein FliK
MQASAAVLPNASATPSDPAGDADTTTDLLDQANINKLFVSTLASASASSAAAPAVRDGAAPAETTSAATVTPDAAANATLAALHAGSLEHAAPSLEPVSQHELTAPVGTAAWNDELGSHLTLMAQQGNQAASLQVSPPDLGPIDVRIAVHDGQASVWFAAVHPDTRDALQQALPRLRELFAAQGMALADAGVFREPPRQQPQSLATTSSTLAAAQEASAGAPVTRTRIGLVDTYA